MRDPVRPCRVCERVWRKMAHGGAWHRVQAAKAFQRLSSASPARRPRQQARATTGAWTLDGGGHDTRLTGTTCESNANLRRRAESAVTRDTRHGRRCGPTQRNESFVCLVSCRSFRVCCGLWLWPVRPRAPETVISDLCSVSCVCINVVCVLYCSVSALSLPLPHHTAYSELADTEASSHRRRAHHRRRGAH